MVQVTQNLGLCLLLSAIGGVLEVLATAALAYPDAKEGEWSKNPWRIRVCTFINLVFQILASVVGNLLAPWYGPVSIVGPTFLSSQLVANMIIYGHVLGLESFTKDMRIGTCVIVTAAILLPVVGPTVVPQEALPSWELLTTWYAHAWNALLLVGMFGSGIILTIRAFSGYCPLTSIRTRYSVLLVARATSFVLNLSFAKVLALQPPLNWLIVSIVIKVLSGMIMTGSIVVQSTTVAQNTFVPLNATFLILVNAMNGLLVWEDWKVLQSPLGYATVAVQLVVGNYLLLGEVDWFGPQHPKYGRRELLERMISTSVNIQQHHTCGSENDDVDDDAALKVVMTNSESSLSDRWSDESSQSHVSHEVASTWIASGRSTPEEIINTEQEPNDVAIAAIPRPRTLAHHRMSSLSNSPSSAPSSTISSPSSSTTSSTTYSRPSPARRSVTTGGANMVSCTQQVSCVQNAPHRSHTTGTMHNPERVARQRSHFFGRQSRWRQIYGVDPTWLEERTIRRRMEPIVEFEEV